MPDPADQDPSREDAEEPTSPYLASELGALWAFLSSRHQPPGDSPEPTQNKKKTMTEHPTRQQLEAELAERAWQDDAFRTDLLADPTAIIRRELHAYGITLPEDITVAVHTESPSQVHLVLPNSPIGSAELSDADLDLVAGGSGEMPALGGTHDDPSQPSCK